MKKHVLALLFCMIFSTFATGIASAHVTVFPKEAVQGAYEKFAVRVPTEKDVPTVKVEVKFPVDDVTVSRFEPKPGWKYEVTKDAEGKINGVIWTAEGEGLLPTEFGEFYMQGKISDKATRLVWKAYQTYKDGSVVEWVGAEGSDKPASVTIVKPKPAGSVQDSHGHTVQAPEQAGSATDHPAAPGGGSQAATYMSAAALIVSLIALIASLMRRKTSR